MATSTNHSKKNIYRVEGLSCANCAKTFEQNVRNIRGVHDAEVNFGASKLTVYGHATIEQLEKAGSFENLAIRNELDSSFVSKPSFFHQHRQLLLSLLLLIGAAIADIALGRDHIIGILLYFLSIVIGGFSLFRTGFINLSRLRFDMRTLMTVAIIGAALIGEWREGAIVVILFAISEALERYSLDKARQSISSLMNVAPKEATVRRKGSEQKIAVEDIQVGDILLVKPGDYIAMDGIIQKGVSSINEATITGESIPVTKSAGKEVYAGTLNGEGFLEVKVTKRVEDTKIQKIFHLVEEAQAKKAPAQAFVDRFATYYTPLIIFIAFITAIVPPLFFQADWYTWVYQGLAVLVVGCPCALVISTPVAIITALGNAARNGVLIKGGIYLEEMGQLNAIAFDKTGTLTEGKPQVTDVISYQEDAAMILRDVAALERHVSHPLGKAITNYAKEKELSFEQLPVEQFQSITGAGIKGFVDGAKYVIAKPTYFSQLSEEQIKTMKQLQADGKSVVVVQKDDNIVATIGVRDNIRSTVPTMLKNLHQLGIKNTLMLTGDHETTAQRIGKEAGIRHIFANLLPEDKLAHIQRFIQEKKKIAMVGDGMNDAPALAHATVGVAMGGAGTDTSLETADVVLMKDDLKKLPFTIKLSKKALGIIKENITFSILIKVFALLLVIPGWLTLWIAIFADMGATLLVTLNGLRLLRVKSE